MTLTRDADRDRARYVMVGGFLGAGKTTAVARLARVLADRGLRVGLITNDQSAGLVDTAILRAGGFAVEEIAGGCFCCRFDSLREAAGRLDQTTRPDVFIAEPVGSCTDLLATVSYPLRRLYGDRYSVAPLSVLVDPARAARVLGLAGGRRFSDKVIYVYRKQLEEADVIVVNKTDTLDDDSRARLVDALRDAFPHAEVLCASARDGAGCEAWFERILSGESALRTTMDLDYDVYAAGEAELGWLNATYALSAPTPVDGNALLVALVEAIRQRVAALRGEIAHLKATLDARDGSNQLAVVSLVTSDGEVDLREALVGGVAAGDLIVNLRATLPPDRLAAVLEEAVAAADGVTLARCHHEFFRPAPPVPTHRDSVPARHA